MKKKSEPQIKDSSNERYVLQSSPDSFLPTLFLFIEFLSCFWQMLTCILIFCYVYLFSNMHFQSADMYILPCISSFDHVHVFSKMLT